MILRSALLLAACLAVADAGSAGVQAPRDSTSSNLVHVPGYAEAEHGVLGAIVERGSGPIDMVLVTGFGLDASVFESFMRRNGARYHMVAITLPGMGKSQAPAMPPRGTSYGEQTWTSNAADAITRAIVLMKLRRPVLVGHFINGTQIAVRIAVEHPELVRSLVLLAGTPRFEPPVPPPHTAPPLGALPDLPRSARLAERIAIADTLLAPRALATVTRSMWTTGTFTAGDYSTDVARGRERAQSASAPPLPVLVRYLCEYEASDAGRELEHLTQPLLVLQPSFTPALRADRGRGVLSGFFEQPWRGVFDHRPRTRKRFIENAGILIMEDQADRVDQELARFLERYGR